MRRAPMPPTYVFVIDTSFTSVQNGFLTSTIETIKDLIFNDSFVNISRTRVIIIYNFYIIQQIAIITYDATINFYNLNPKLNQPQMLCLTEELFLPAPLEFLLANLEDSKTNILNLLDLIRDVTPKTQTCKDSNKLLMAIKAAFLLLQSSGGKVISFNSSQSFAHTVIIIQIKI